MATSRKEELSDNYKQLCANKMTEIDFQPGQKILAKSTPILAGFKGSRGAD